MVHKFTNAQERVDILPTCLWNTENSRCDSKLHAVSIWWKNPANNWIWDIIVPTTKRQPKRARSILCLHCLSCCWLHRTNHVPHFMLPEWDTWLVWYNSSSNVETKNALSSLFALYWLYAHLCLIFSCLLRVFYHIDMTCSLLSHLQFSVFHKHV